jgi:hypothetical protein
MLRIMKLRYKYGFAQDWERWPKCVQSIKDIPEDHEYLCFYREKASHKGISNYLDIKQLIAKQVNSDFLGEISKLRNLVYLNLEIVTADSLKALSKLEKLKTLKIYGVRKANDFSSLMEIPSLQNLFIENAKHLHTLEDFSEAHHIKALGVEGGMYTKQKIDSLQPLEGLKELEVLYMSSVQLKDKNLNCLASIPQLKALECARFAPKKNFEQLRRLLPDLECGWCDQYEI